MEILLWMIVVALFVISIAGVFMPVLPDTLLLWGGFLLYQFAIAEPGAGLPASFWWGMAVLSVLIFGADILMSMYFVKKYGGSKWSSLGAIAGVILGIMIFPPFGIIIFPFLIVFAIEMFFQNQPADRALKAGLGSLVAFFSSAVMKVAVQIIMIIWFFIAI
ncbi:DUF456 domain-containing protein [Brevibacillus massiliensis]|uniref:DUF456 domain-containing protein n=1 Tax=Brevibacillus massiliensis TaxID=1118054 RepID=UPI00030D0281|nr:DUF456 domain-containing protein [Brevibacillus massiliensis]